MNDYFASAETHSAVVLFVGDQALKFKKPVNLGFLDFSTLERRRQACEREVELNRRIAPDVYTGVSHVAGADGQICEYLVSMRRMPIERRLATLVTSGEEVERPLRQIARQVAVFHASARRGPEIAAEGTRDAIRRRWTDTFRQLRGLAASPLPEPLLDEVETLTLEFLDGRAGLFDARVADGRVVDGHGDLLADDIFCLPDGPRILDCIDFNDRLRWLDELDDAAFLAMDLEYLGAPDLAARYLDWYAEFAADPAPLSLRHHFLAYRAFVRAKVACIRYSQGGVAAAESAVRHAQLALARLREGVVTVTLVGGLPGTGKSTLAGSLADKLGAVLLTTDRLRKELAEVSPYESAAAPFEAGIYTPQWTERVYAEMLRRTEELVRVGESVVLDASWTSARHRELARSVADDTSSRLVELRCTAPSNVAVERIRTRAGSLSDADATVQTLMAAAQDPWPEAADVDTTGAEAETLSHAVAVVRPGAPTDQLSGDESAQRRRV